MKWYLKKEEGEIYGPVTLQDLARWAMEGRLSPSDTVSTNKESWRPTHELPELGMDWSVCLPEEEPFGPFHIMALAHLVDDGDINPSCHVRHKSSDEDHVLSEVLLGVLMDRNASIQTSFDAMTIQLLELEADLQSQRLSSMPDDKQNPQESQKLRQHLKELATRTDMLEKENRKWKNLYETELGNSGRTIKQLNNRIEELRQSDSQGRTRLEETVRRLKQLEHSYSTLLNAADTATAGDTSEVARQFADLLESYGQISHSYDSLYTQLMEKIQESEGLLDSRREVEQHADERLRNMEILLRREQKEADAARAQLAKMQESHYQLVQSFRDLNDRFIHMCQDRHANIPPSSDAQNATSPDANPDGGPRIRLNR